MQDRGPKVLDNLTLAVPEGSFHFLTGPSGSGKTTLLKLIYGALLPSAGHLRILDQRIEPWPASGGRVPRHWPAQRARLRQSMGLLFQDFRLIDHLTVAENVALPVRLARPAGSPPRPNLDQEIVDLLTWLGLGDRSTALPAALSGGQQQRVALARAIISRPRLLICDEPTGNLDDGLGQRLIFLLAELNRLGTTVLVATHNSALLRRFAYPVIELAAGRLVRPVATGSAA